MTHVTQKLSHPFTDNRSHDWRASRCVMSPEDFFQISGVPIDVGRRRRTKTRISFSTFPKKRSQHFVWVLSSDFFLRTSNLCQSMSLLWDPGSADQDRYQWILMMDINVVPGTVWDTSQHGNNFGIGSMSTNLNLLCRSAVHKFGSFFTDRTNFPAKQIKERRSFWEEPNPGGFETKARHFRNKLQLQSGLFFQQF